MSRSTSSLTQKSEHFLEFSRYMQADEEDETAIETARQLLFMLTSSQREVLALSIEGLRPAEIADELCISPQAVYSRVCSAKKVLKRNAKYFLR